MIRYAILSSLLLVAFPAGAQQPAAGGNGIIAARSDPKDFDLAREKVKDCDGEKFVFAWGAGAQPTKVTLCSRKDATHEQVVGMLEDAASKIEQTTSIPEDRRAALAEQIRGKIRELEARLNPPAAPVSAMPEAQAPAQVADAGPGAAVTPPAATPAPFKPLLPAKAAAMPARPRLGFQCYTPGDIGSGGPCTTLGRETRLTIKAGEDIAAGTNLRFVRNGDQRADLALGAMRKGQSVRLTMPVEVCKGVVESEVEIRVMRGTYAVDTLGPYLIRC